MVRTFVLFMSTLLLGGAVSTAQSIQSSYNVDDMRIALQGYSPVSYIDDGVAEMGSKDYKTQHDGVTYYFTSAEQKKTFEENPEKYVPEYGGYCAMGVVGKKKLRVDPDSFIVKDDNLYMFANNIEVDAKQMWVSGDQEELITKADHNWEIIKTRP